MPRVPAFLAVLLSMGALGTVDAAGLHILVGTATGYCNTVEENEPILVAMHDQERALVEVASYNYGVCAVLGLSGVTYRLSGSWETGFIGHTSPGLHPCKGVLTIGSYGDGTQIPFTLETDGLGSCAGSWEGTLAEGG